LARIYTRTGDKGQTGLVDGIRTSKDTARVVAYGNVDELNSVLGIVRAASKDQEINSLLESLQKDLFTVGADLATVRRGAHPIPRVTGDMVTSMENAIDRFQEELPPLKVFILPSGSQTGTLLHFARAVARRAERNIVALARTEDINENLIPYLNRLSDLLFVIARVANHREGQEETEWHSA
jgi:cob(I)alamin adenosyltransferase